MLAEAGPCPRREAEVVNPSPMSGWPWLSSGLDWTGRGSLQQHMTCPGLIWQLIEHGAGPLH